MELTPQTPTPAADNAKDEKLVLHRRFDRIGRLVGDDAMETLMRSHVMVIGLGGVGSWAAESLARTGVGRLTLVDFDEICITNFNRQLHALQGLVGKQKSEVMTERLSRIHPQAEITAMARFYNADSCDEILGPEGSRGPDFVIDAIDNITAKCHLLATCKKRGIPVISSTGSSGRLDPTRIQIADLSETSIDPLAKAVRKILRQQYGYPETGSFGIPAVFSPEPPTAPEDLAYDKGQGFKCVCPQGDNPYFQCDNRNIILGNSSFVTGAFGFACSSYVVRALIGRLPQ